jgi:hypothetical protein
LRDDSAYIWERASKKCGISTRNEPQKSVVYRRRYTTLLWQLQSPTSITYFSSHHTHFIQKESANIET